MEFSLTKSLREKSSAVLVLALVASFFSSPAQADSAITIGTTTFGAGVATNVGVNLSGFDESQNYQVTVKFVNTSTNVDVTNGTLAATQSGTSLVPTYTSYSAAKLGFTGTYSQISSALSTLTWNPSSASGDISIRIGIASKPAANDFYDANSGHYYRYVSTGTTWALAKSAAASTTLFGLTGYLAHITSKAENDFIANEMIAPNIWIGATDQAVPGQWNEGQWRFEGAIISGENDVFNTWSGPYSLTSSKTGYGLNDWYPGRVAGWNVDEPNGRETQSCGVTNYITLNNWDDLQCSATQGYLIEFGGRSGETSTASTTTLTRTVVAREAVTLGTLNSNVSCTYGVNCSFPLSLTNPTAKNSSNVDVAGTFTYTSSNTDSTTVSAVTGGASVALVNAGSSTITATFTPTDAALYASNTKTFTITVAATAPAAPTGLAASGGNTQATLSWTAASSGGSNITDYLIQYSTDNSNWTTFADGTSTATSATVTGLTNGTLYYFRVSAINAVNTSAASSTASTTTVVSVTYALGTLGTGSVPTQTGKLTGETFTVASGSGLSRAGFTFNGWKDASNNSYAYNSIFTVASTNVTLTAQWRQSSLFGISDSDLSTASTLAFTTGGNLNRTISFDDGISSATVRVPFNAFSTDVDVKVQALTDTNFAKNKVDASKSFPINLVVSWLGTDGTVPVASNALTLTINNPSIKAGSTAYQIIGDDVTALGTATIDGQIVVSLTSDPVISVTNDIVSNNNNDNGGGSSSNVVASAAKSVVSSIQTSLFRPSLTVYSASPRFSLDTLTKLKLKKYAKKQKKNSSITCIGYIYPNTKSTKTTKLATAQATNVCKYLKTQNKTLKTIIEIKSAKTAPIAAPGARWITTSYRVDGVLVRAL
jgi:uncharacterized repeat protein (TIGR02543 family)